MAEGRALGVASLGVGVLAGAAIASRSIHPPTLALWGAVAAWGFGTAAAALTPRAASRDGVVFGGAVVGIGAAMLVGGTALALGLVLTALAVVGANRPGLGGVMRPLVFGSPLFYGALAAGHAVDGVLPWVLATWLIVLRAAVLTHTATGSWRVWLGAALALAYVPASLLLPARGGYSGYYFLTVLFADLAILVVATRLLVGRGERLVGFVNTALGLSVVALVAGRVL